MPNVQKAAWETDPIRNDYNIQFYYFLIYHLIEKCKLRERYNWMKRQF